MTGDPLDLNDPLVRIEAAWVDALEDGDPYGMCAEVLALVEVARAARDLLESRLWNSGESNESWQKANALAAALARLDGPR